MADANTQLELTDGDRQAIGNLALAMKIVAAVLLLLAGVNVIGGGLTLLTGAPVGLLAIVEGAVTGLLGLIMLSCSTDVRFLGETKYTSSHLGNAFQNLAVFYQTQLVLAFFLIAVTVIRLLMV